MSARTLLREATISSHTTRKCRACCSPRRLTLGRASTILVLSRCSAAGTQTSSKGLGTHAPPRQEAAAVCSALTAPSSSLAADQDSNHHIREGSMADPLSVGLLGWRALQHLLPQSAAAAGGGTTRSAGVFISPLSLYVALVLLRDGCGSSSTTLDEVNALLVDAPPGELATPAAEEQHDVAVAQLLDSLSSPDLLLANAVWSNGVELLQGYQSQVERHFKAVARAATSVSDINAWVHKATRGLIQELLPQGTPFDLVLTNALYFKGAWEKAFDASHTRPHPFKLPKGPPVMVQMMDAKFKRQPGPRAVRYADTPAFAGVALPYKGCNLAAYAILPKQATAAVAVGGASAAAGAGTGTSALAGLQLADLLNQQHWGTPPEVSVALPKFKVSSQHGLTDCLQALGMQAAFDPASANLSRLSAEPLYVSNVLQSVVVEVDEQGTTAAAATAVVMMRCAAVMREPLRLVFDRPFLFMVVQEESLVPLFMGWVENPAAA